MNPLGRFLILTLTVTSLAGCSLESSITNLTSIVDQLPTINSQRTEPDFVTGEVVTTGNGVVIKGTFGEISEKQVLNNGVTIEGAFYE